MQRNQQVSCGVGLAHDVRIIGGEDLAQSDHRLRQQGQRCATVDGEEDTEYLKGDIGDLMPGRGGGDHGAGSVKAAFAELEDAIECAAGEGRVGVEGPDAPVDAEHEVALDEDEGGFGVGEVEDGGEGGLELGEVLRGWTGGVEAFGEREKMVQV